MDARFTIRCPDGTALMVTGEDLEAWVTEDGRLEVWDYAPNDRTMVAAAAPGEWSTFHLTKIVREFD